MKQLILPINNNDQIWGDMNAPLELVEYGDYECPYCGRAYPIIKEIQRLLGSDLRFVFRNFPLSRIHPHAFSAAVAAEASARQDRFWEMHDIIFEHQMTLEKEDILLFANSLDLDIARFQDDMRQQALIDKVEADFESGIRSGVNRTPTFFINGKKYEGEWADGQLLPYLTTVLNGSGVL
jgi:protein-disulfide isomerase